VLANVARLAQPLAAADQVHRTMTALNCFACHTRGTDGPPKVFAANISDPPGSLILAMRQDSSTTE